MTKGEYGDFQDLAYDAIDGMHPSGSSKGILAVLTPGEPTRFVTSDSLTYPNLVNAIDCILEIEVEQIGYCNCDPCNSAKRRFEKLRDLMRTFPRVGVS